MSERKEQMEAFGRLLDIMDELREKCPWDREQTMESLRNLTIEETYELADAILDEEMEEISKELGDLALHIVFYAKIGKEKGEFDISDVLHGVCEKLIRRHPHVFGERSVSGAREVETNWEEIKLKEGVKKRVLSGVPGSLPAMIKAHRIQDKARAVGFDWSEKSDIWNKIQEELLELQNELEQENQKRMEEEFGDLLFSVVNAARLYHIEPETALERTNKKFIRRFNHIEATALKQGRSIRKMTLDEMETLWQEGKKMG